AFRAAEDPIDLKGGDARTGDDGRFAVMLPASGGGELRVGGGVFPIRRITLPRAVVPLLDLGDIDLGTPLEITIVLDQDSPCYLDRSKNSRRTVRWSGGGRSRSKLRGSVPGDHRRLACIDVFRGQLVCRPVPAGCRAPSAPRPQS